MAEDHIPTAEEYTLFREAYAETYPVRPLLNAIDAKDAEIKRLRAALETIRQGWETFPWGIIAREALRSAPET